MKGVITMNKKKTVCRFTIEAEVYDVKLPKKIEKEMTVKALSFDPEMCYALNIVFDKRAYSKSEFYRFPLDKEHGLRTQKYSGVEKQYAIRDSLLSQQLSEIVA
jgi:hypothetical protein